MNKHIKLFEQFKGIESSLLESFLDKLETESPEILKTAGIIDPEEPPQENEAFLIWRKWVELQIKFGGIFAKVSDEKSENSKVLKRKIQTMMSLASIGVLVLFVLYYRMNTGCEFTSNGQLWPIILIIIVGMLFTFLGHGWYSVLSSINESCFSDLFGIANRLIEPDVAANDTRPVACIPTP